ncbi:MAG: hypothetical protein ACNYWM_11780 [Methanosarcinales archaeon]
MITLTIKVKHPEYGDEVETMTDNIYCANVRCEIRCLNCNKLFPSPIQFGGIKSFLSSDLIGNKAQCPFCGLMTDCNKNNMLFDQRDSEGRVHHEEGKDTF